MKKTLVVLLSALVMGVVCGQNTQVVENAKASPIAAAKSQKSTSQLEAEVGQGNLESMFALAILYSKGENGVSLDASKAVNLLAKAAEKNYAPAQAYLGYLYGEGKLVKRDFDKAVYWRELAAANGTSADKFSLGNAFFFGFYLPKDITKAVFWISQAAEEGDGTAIAKLIDIYKVLKNDEQVNFWQTKFSLLEVEAAKKGNVDAMAAVAAKYMKGKDGLPRNRAEAIFWYKKAADMGNFDSMEKVAQMYAKGRFLPRNPQKAQAYFEKLAAIDNNYCFKISKYYADGKDGFPLDMETSVMWYEKGAENSDISTQAHLAWKYWAGSGIPQNNAKAILWCEKIVKLMPSESERSRNQMEIFVLKMYSDIKAGKTAPLDYGKYVSSSTH